MPARNYIELIEKAVRVIEFLARPGGARSLKEIAAATGLVKSSAFRILYTLHELGYVDRDRGGYYRLSLKVLGWSRTAAGQASLIRIARPHLERLRDELGESVWLAERRGLRVYLVDVAESDHPLRLSLRLGDASPLHASAVGKAVAAFLRPEELEAALNHRPLCAFTKNTITDRTALLSHLAEVRRRGYAVNDEETIEGAVLFGAAIMDAGGQPFAAISVGCLAVQCTPERRERYGRRVRECAAELSAIFGELGFVSACRAAGETAVWEFEAGEATGSRAQNPTNFTSFA
jgi:IclR family acetate operon transcriptional repressor